MKIKVLIIFFILLLTFYIFITINSEDNTKIMLSDGRFRSFNIVVPDFDEKMPLVFVLHGAGGNARTAENSFKFTEYAKKNNFIVVYPNGTNILPFSLSWNGGICCSYAVQYEVNDVLFFTELINNLEKKYNIDSDRIFFTGFSNGGYMSHRMACELSEKINSIASLSGSIGIDKCNPQKEVSVLILHGTKDLQVPYYGGVGPAALDGRFDKPTQYGFDLWKNNNECDSELIKTENGNIVTEKYNNCKNNSKVKLKTFFGQDHFWSRGQEGLLFYDTKNQQNINVTKKILEFFELI